MAANTITGQQILFKMARDVHALKSGLVTATADTTHLRMAALSQSTDDFFNGALIREQGSSSIAIVSDYTGSTREFVLSTALAPALLDRFEFCWWNAEERIYAWEAINEAIRQSWEFWERDTEDTRSTATLTLDQDTYTYTLPSGVAKLYAIGVQPDATVEPDWFLPMSNWHVSGQEGALVLTLHPNFGLQHTYDGEPLLLRYGGREPELTAETGTTQLPLDYFWVASREYVENALNDASRLDLVTANVNIPMIQQKAADAVARLKRVKPPPKQVPVLQF